MCESEDVVALAWLQTGSVVEPAQRWIVSSANQGSKIQSPHEDVLGPLLTSHCQLVEILFLVHDPLGVSTKAIIVSL